MTTGSPDQGEPDGSPLAQSILEWPARLAGAMSVLLILLVFLLVIYAIFQRYVFDTPLKWGDEMAGYMLVAFVMAGIGEALRRDDHISIDLLSSRLSGEWAKAARIFSLVAVIVFSFVLGASAFETVTFSYDFGSYSPGYLEAPMWIPQLAVLIGAVLLGLAAIGKIVGALGGKPRS